MADILGNVANARDKAIVRGEKARVGRALYALALTNKNPEFWRTDRPPIKKEVRKVNAVEQVVEYPDPLFKQRDNVIVVKVPTRKGSIVERAIIFNERDPRAMRMAQSIKSLDTQDLHDLLAVAAPITRYFSSINTQYNPIFGVVNRVRDVQTAMLNLAGTCSAQARAGGWRRWGRGRKVTPTVTPDAVITKRKGASLR